MSSADTAKERLLALKGVASSTDDNDPMNVDRFLVPKSEPVAADNVAEYTGGSVSYYAIDVLKPVNETADPYTAECQDIINALKLDFNEGSAFKAIWRRAAARLGKAKKGYDEGLYDAEKAKFYGNEMVRMTPKESK